MPWSLNIEKLIQQGIFQIVQIFNDEQNLYHFGDSNKHNRKIWKIQMSYFEKEKKNFFGLVQREMLMKYSTLSPPQRLHLIKDLHL